jgi:hypothetical protein
LNNLNFVADSTAPAAITDLAVCAVGSHDVTLSWTAPGNDNYTSNISSGIYEVRFTTTPSQAWDSMPWNYLNYDIIWSTSVTACQRQSRTITNLTPDSTFYFSIKLADDSFNWSPVSPSATMYIAP